MALIGLTKDRLEMERHTADCAAPLTRAAKTIAPREAVLVFCLVGLLSTLSSILGHHSDGVVIWLSNGLLFGVVIRKPRDVWLTYAALGCAADILCSALIGETIPTSIVASGANSLEIFLSAWLLTSWFGAPFKLSRPKPLFGFLGTGVIAVPALACTVTATWLTLRYGAPWLTTWRTWFLGDALGMAIVAPLVFAILEPGFFHMFRARDLPFTLLTLTAPALAALLDFGLGTEPVIFFVLPALVFVAFRLGFPGTVVGIGLAVCIAIPLTVSGHGPMMLSVGTNLLHKIVVVQVFLAFSLFTAFPVAALLEQRTALERSLRQREIELFELANTDALTGQANRRAFDERLEAEWQYAAARRLPLALLSIDIDLFKSFNDIYGHLAGDDCLRHIATLAAQAIPPSSTARLYRLGGEEFAVIYPGVDTAEANALAEQIRQAIFSARIEHTGSPLGRQTVSVGTVTTVPTLDKPALSLLALSDRALYAAKHNGRNRCVAAA